MIELAAAANETTLFRKVADAIREAFADDDARVLVCEAREEIVILDDENLACICLRGVA